MFHPFVCAAVVAAALAVVVLFPAAASGGQAVARPVESLPLAGSLDPSFGSGGVVPEGAGAIALQPDGKIVAVGSVARSATDVDFGVARLNSNGTADATFGNPAFGAGKAIVPFDLGGDVGVPRRLEASLLVYRLAYLNGMAVPSLFRRVQFKHLKSAVGWQEEVALALRIAESTEVG